MLKNKRLWLIPAVLIFVLLAGTLFILSPAFFVQAKQQLIICEAGSGQELNAKDILEGDDWCVNLSIVDDTGVNYKKVGTYPITVYHGFKQYTATVEVVDTTPPQLSCSMERTTVPKGKVLNLEYLGVDAKDNTGISRLLFQHVKADKIWIDNDDFEQTENMFLEGRDIWTDEYEFIYGGIYTLTIAAVDAYDNVSYQTLEVVVEEAPVLTVESEVYLAIGQTIDFRNYISVWDFLEEDYSTDRVIIDTSGVDITKAGEYQVSYSAKDEFGLESNAVSKVYVKEASALQELVSSHVINMTDHLIVGAPNVYDVGFFKTEDTALVQNALRPATVHIINSADDSYGSGYILKIDDEFVTIATNHHVIVDDLTPEIVFYDGTRRIGSVVGSDAREDIAFIRIPIRTRETQSSLSRDYVKRLRTVHINEDYWENLDNEAKISLCYTSIDENGDTWEEAVGHMVYKEATRDWNQYTDLNECIISMPPIPGTSGSAIHDGYGHFIAMIRGYTDYGDYVETVAVPLGEILDFYEMVFHAKLYE